MRNAMTSSLTRWRDAFLGFSVGQKMAVLVGTAALVLAGFLLFRWVTTPDMAPLYGNLSSQDASAVVDELDSRGISYELANNGATIMVPKDDVYATRIALSGKGLPTNSDGGGYSLLDKQDLTTSQFGEQTAFKRAMEGELSKTIAAMDPVQSAVVHLALPAKQVFADEQDPATASVLVRTELGRALGPEQVQAVVHLVASSIDGLDPANVTVADATGKVLTTDDSAAGAAGTRSQQVDDFSHRMRAQVQATLDRVVGPGNSTVQVTADLDFDKAHTERRTFESDPEQVPLTERRDTEKYSGPNGPGGTSGVVGPDGQMDGSTTTDGADSAYEKESVTRDNAVNSTVETRETAPGGVKSLSIAAIIDSRVAGTLDLAEVRKSIAAATGISRTRGDSLRVSTMPFDRSAEEAMNAELAAADKAEADAKRMALYKNVAIGLGVALLVAIAFWQQRRKAKARAEATSYVVEQLREEAAARAAQPIETNPAMLALEGTEAQERSEQQRIQDELVDLVERQPEEVAALLRGWLVDPS